MSAPKTLLDTVLQTETSFLIYGVQLPLAKILDTLAAKLGKAQPIDVRDPAKEPSDAELRKAVAGQLSAGARALILLTGPTVSDRVRVLVTEFMDGEVRVGPGDSRKVPANARVVALTAAESPEAPFASLFGTRLAGARLFDVPASSR